MKKWGVIDDPILVSPIHFGCVIGDHHISSTPSISVLFALNLSCGVTSSRSYSYPPECFVYLLILAN